jgi:hypothetical protein
MRPRTWPVSGRSSPCSASPPRSPADHDILPQLRQAGGISSSSWG